MNWKQLNVPSGGKIFKVHSFTYIFKGITFHLEVDEYGDGTFTGHGEHSIDKNYLIESVSAKTLEQCIDQLLQKISART